MRERLCKDPELRESLHVKIKLYPRTKKQRVRMKMKEQGTWTSQAGPETYWFGSLES